MTDDLKRLQGIWSIASLELDARAVPAPMLAEGRIEVTGSEFKSTGMGATYAGTLHLDESSKPKQLDMHFTSGPEAGNTNLCIYELKGDVWKLCIAMRGSERPKRFAAPVDSGIALETLRREAVPAKAVAATAAADGVSGTVSELEGEWAMVSMVQDGKPLDGSFVQWVSRSMRGSRTEVTAGPQTMLKANFTSDPTASPKTVDYVLLAGSAKGQTQLGIYKMDGDLLSVCMAAPGKPRATEFASSKGDGATYSVWRRK